MALMMVSLTLSSGATAADEFFGDLGNYLSYAGFSTDELYYEMVNGSEYVYIVENGEATILNIQVNYSGPEKKPFVLPTELGGYPVTTIGSSDRERTVEVLIYYAYGSDSDDVMTEYDPSLRYVSEIVIPEGYKYIKDRALANFSCGKVSFPKSIRQIYGQAFEELYTHVDDNNVKYTVLPECEYVYDNYFASVGVFVYRPVYFPSRKTSSDSDEMLLQKLYQGEIYLPSNFNSEIIRDVLFIYGPNPNNEDERVWQGDENESYGKNTTIHCSPDSEFLEVFNEITCRNYYTIVTDVTPAEYIAFPSETVNVNVGEVMDLEAKTYPDEAIWTACDYTVSDPSIVKIDEYSGRITALKEGTVTVTATHCERGYVDTCTVNVTTKPAPGVNGIEPATDTPYVTYGNRDYKINVTGSPSKIQVVRDNGGTTTIDRRKAQVTSNGDTETWIVNMRVEAGTHNIRAKYGKVWDDKLTPFTVKYDLPGAYSFDLTYENGIGNFNVVTDPEVIKIQFALDNGCTLTYSQTKSYIGEDGLRHWEILRKIPSDTIFTLRTKYGYTWTDTNFEVNTIV